MLEQAVERAEAKREKTVAHDDLGLFHDNNGREAEALARLAPSLYKTGNPEESLELLNGARTITMDPSLMVFLNGLERRVWRVLHEKT